MDGHETSALASEKREEPGAYVAALKGSKSLPWQQQPSTPCTPLPSNSQGTAKPSISGNAVLTGGAVGGSGGGSCFKCGKLGHWARDCNVLGGGGGGGSGGGAERKSSDPSLLEKPCPCGLGTCLVLTANTEKNRGRKFYKCPVREEHGGCGFFEWCDKSLGTPVSNGAQTKPTNSSFPDLQCPCGAGNCFILTAKTGKNVGQQFYRCPSNQGCGFFKWCGEHTPSTGLPTSSSQVYTSLNDTSSKSYHERSSSSCFKCGHESHWARDCPKPSSDSSTEEGARSGGRTSSSCFKCGQNGHWARFCSNPSSGSSAEEGARSGGRSSLSCFKCGQEGHWARDCPKPSYDSSAEVGTRSGSSGTCFKCSKHGHWARDCSG